MEYPGGLCKDNCVRESDFRENLHAGLPAFWIGGTQQRDRRNAPHPGTPGPSRTATIPPIWKAVPRRRRCQSRDLEKVGQQGYKNQNDKQNIANSL